MVREYVKLLNHSNSVLCKACSYRHRRAKRLGNNINDGQIKQKEIIRRDVFVDVF